MIYIPELTSQTLQELDTRHRRLLKQRKQVGPCAKRAYDWAIDQYTAEIERRADILPITVVVDLINSCCPFTFQTGRHDI